MVDLIVGSTLIIQVCSNSVCAPWQLGYPEVLSLPGSMAQASPFPRLTSGHSVVFPAVVSDIGRRLLSSGLNLFLIWVI